MSPSSLPQAPARVSGGAGLLHAVPLHLLTTEAELDALLPEWDALWRRVPHASPFIAPAWLLAWWRTLGGGALRVITARVEGRLVAVLPLFVWDNAGTRRLLPLGISVSDQFDLLAEPGFVRAVVPRLGPALAQGEGVGGRDWDRCELHELAQNSPLLWLGGTGLRPLVQRQSTSPVLDLAAFARLGSRASPVRNLRRAWQRAGAARIEPVPARERDAAMEQLFALHTAQWQARGEPGVLAGQVVQRFHQEAAAGLAQLGALQLHRLHVGGAVAGVYYGFLHGRRAYAYALGTDPAQASLNPGRLLIGEAIRAAGEAGAVELDFLRGEEPYKYGWGAVDRITLQLTLVPPASDAGARFPLPASRAPEPRAARDA